MRDRTITIRSCQGDCGRMVVGIRLTKSATQEVAHRKPFICSSILKSCIVAYADIVDDGPVRCCPLARLL